MDDLRSQRLHGTFDRSRRCGAGTAARASRAQRGEDRAVGCGTRLRFPCLPAELEDEFDSCWAGWTESADQWTDFFQQLQSVKGPDLLAVLSDLGVITPDEVQLTRKLRREAENRAVRIPDVKSIDRATVSLLAAGFFRGEPGEPAIPYARIGKA